MEGIRLSPAPHSKPSQCEPMCGATNPILGLRCTRPPHPAGTAHYQTNSTGVHAWPDHSAVAGAAPTGQESER